jgi:predicted DNA-binding transcriptional regulator YafY
VSECIDIRQPITITYYRMDHKEVKHRLLPIAILFTEYYFYLLAYKDGAKKAVPYYFRIDRITKITRHRTTFTLTRDQNFDEGLLRRRSQFMWPGKLRNIRFEFSGPSVQAILDRLPTAKIIDVKNKTYTLEAEVYGDGIKIYLLSQGSWVKVLAPQEFADEIKAEIEKMRKYYT